MIKTYFQGLRQWARSEAASSKPQRRFPQGSLRESPTAATYLTQIEPEVQASLTAQQWSEIERVVDLAIPRPAPKLVDLRFEIDLVISRYFIVLMVGKDRRRTVRNVSVSRLTQVGNWIAAVVLLLGFNLALSTSVVMLIYLIKSALGIDLLPGHLGGLMS